MRIRTAVAAIALVLPGLSCDTYVGTSGQTAVTRTFLMDSPFPYHRVARVDLYVVSVSGSLVPDTSAGSTSFVTLAEPHRLINVLALQNGLADELGNASLPTGEITAVRMVIDTDSSSMTLTDGRKLTSTSSPGIDWQLSAGRPVLNALINEEIGVGLTGGIVVIDYDVGQGFIPKQELDPVSTDSGFIFSPVLRAADANRSGWITGTVRAKVAGGTPVSNASLRLYLGTPGTDENTWIMLGTAKTDGAGVFRFSMVTRSAWWAQNPIHAGKTYIVSADAPPSANLGRSLVTNLTVVPAAGTETGTIVLP
jgi:hypothetical protein